MSSLDKFIIGAEITRKQFKTKLTPRSIAAAQTWAITYTNTLNNCWEQPMISRSDPSLSLVLQTPLLQCRYLRHETRQRVQ
jgi:hypothetical protein